MDLALVTEVITCFVLVWSTLVMGTLVWRHIVITRRARVSMGPASNVETLHSTLAMEAAAVARARRMRH
jgi:hypothetical protein